MRLQDLLSRTDDQTLQDLLGRSSLRLLWALDTNLVTPSSLQQLVLDLHTAEGLLLSKEKRSLLFDALPVTDIEKLMRLLKLKHAENVFAKLDALKNCKIARGSEKEKALFAYFELEVPSADTVVSYPVTSEIIACYPLFPHQRRAVSMIKNFIYSGSPRAILHMPTGSGKTRTAMNIISGHFRDHEPTCVLWLAYSEELCEQAVDEFQNAWRYLGNREIKVHRFWGNYTIRPEEINDGILIAGLSKTFSAAKRSLSFLNELGKRVSLIVIDEAHSAVAETYKLVLDTLLAQHPNTPLLGLTATPGRTWNNVDLDQELANFFFKQKVTLEVDNYTNPIDYLVEEGYLARANFEPLLYQGGLTLSAVDIKQIHDGLDITQKVLDRIAEDEKRNLKIILEVEKLARDNKRIIIFAATVDHSDMLATVLRARGYLAYSVTSRTGDTVRKKVIDGFKDESTEVKILCNYGVLTTGFDAPKTSAAIIARPTKSLVLYSQMVGRAIRGVKAGGNRVATIVTIVDQNLPGFTSISDAFQNWEDIWE